MATQTRAYCVGTYDLHDNWKLQISVRWNAGGINYWNYELETKGYDLIVKTFQLSDGSTTWTMGNPGYRQRLEEATRFNRKRMIALGDALTDEQIDDIRQRIAKEFSDHE